MRPRDVSYSLKDIECCYERSYAIYYVHPILAIGLSMKLLRYFFVFPLQGGLLDHNRQAKSSFQVCWLGRPPCMDMLINVCFDKPHGIAG